MFLLIEAPSCIAPAGNVTVVDDCANSMFSIDVDVTNLGSATTVNIFDWNDFNSCNSYRCYNSWTLCFWKFN